MDGKQSEQHQSGLRLPYYAETDHQSNGSSSDQASAAQYAQGQDQCHTTFLSSATPTSEFGSPPSSARSDSFPEYIQRQHYPIKQNGSAEGIAQTETPSQPSPDGHASNQNGNSIRSNSNVPIDPSSTAASPTYPPRHQKYSSYPPQHKMPSYDQDYPGFHGRPEWGGYDQQSPTHMGGHYGVSLGLPSPAMVWPVQRPPTGGQPISTVYSFISTPSAQQHKRPRRRYEEVERMYKCGWNGCQKAYGTLNHLNGHVTTQSHGPKRTPQGIFERPKTAPSWQQHQFS